MPFSAHIRHVAQVSFVDLSGHLTSFETSGLRDSISSLLAQGRRNIVLNATGLSYLDSSGVGELVRNYMTVIKQGGDMKVVGLTSKVQEILKVTKLHQVLQEFENEESALNSFPEKLVNKKSA
jgi:anti-sigma B factor antagonist